MATRSKVGGRILAEIDGLTISVNVQKARRSGKNRMWIHIRQNSKPKRWRVSTCLSYARSLDVQFVEAPEDAAKE
jgi:hypothetical protein